MTVLKNKHKKILPVKRSIEEILFNRYGLLVSDEVLQELLLAIEQEYIRRIRIKNVKGNDYKICFECNLSPDEMKSRAEEVSLNLPRTRAGDDYTFNVVLDQRQGDGEMFLPRQNEKTGEWIYFAFA